MTSSLHPVTVEIIRNHLIGTTGEMKVALMRAARSPILREAGDLSCALASPSGEIVAQGLDLPIHLGVISSASERFAAHVASTGIGLYEGDVFFTNSMQFGGNHLPDVKCISPLFVAGTLVGYSLTLAHWPEIGGYAAGGYFPHAREIFQEGLQIPPVRMFSGWEPNAETLEFVLHNVRTRDDTRGDIYAQVAAARVAHRRVAELGARYGAAELLDCYEHLLQEAETKTRAAIRELPNGVYHGEDKLDDDGVSDAPITIRVKTTIGDDSIEVDFAGSDPDVVGPVNATPAVTAAAVYYFVRALCGTDIDTNGGCYRPITILSRQGSIVNPRPSAPVVAGSHETSNRIVDALFKSVSNEMPTRVPASAFGSAGVLLLSGRAVSSWAGKEQPWLYYESHGGGGGASHLSKGENGLRNHMGNTMNTPVEIVEQAYPVECLAYELIDGSGGAGRFPGGMGVRRVVRVGGDDVSLTTVVERCKFAPWGLLGGGDGRMASVSVTSASGERRAIPGKGSVAVARGDVVVIETAGGGGYGEPLARSDAAS
jgi:N-methylhydantoinase B